MNTDLYKALHEEGSISDSSFEKIREKYDNPMFSVHWELKTILYSSVLLLTTGLGTLIYKNIDSIGHQFVLLFIALMSIGCFWYCFKNKLPFSKAKVPATNAAFDYILLLASISFVSFLGYLQFQYTVFGTNYGLATLIPAIALFLIAYYFDHLGILSMAIASLAVWMGISVTPKQLLIANTFNSQTIIYTYLLLGILLLTATVITQRINFKRHFSFSYQHYGTHVAFISLLAGYFYNYDNAASFIWLICVFILGFLIYRNAFSNKSFYFFLLVILYSYVALSSLVIRGFTAIDNGGAFSLLPIYFIASGIGLIILLTDFNKKFKA